MLKVAVVGIGGISGAHIPAWISMEDIELVALCDIRLSQLEKHTDFRTYTDFDEMLEKETIDILDICLPTFLHVEFSIKAMNKGINVVCEKPISLNKEDVRRVYDVAEKNNVKFMVAQVLRFWPEYEFVKELVNNKKYGKLLTGSMKRLNICPDWSWDGWMSDENRSGLVPFDLHIHDLDFLVYALGKPTEIKSFRSKRPEQDVIEVIYDFNGAFVNCEATWYAGMIPFSAGFRFQFEKAVLVYSEGKLTIYEDNGSIICNSNGDNTDSSNTLGLPQTDAYANELRYFTDCVLKNAQPDKIKPFELENVIDILKSL